MKLRIPLAVVGAVGAGVVMSFGQTVAPQALAPFFNSAAPVVALAAALALVARSWGAHAVLGAAAGPLAMAGYYGTSALRGFGVSTSMVVMWCTAGVISGVVMGLAVWMLRGGGAGVRFIWTLRALGAAVFPAVAIGEAAHGLIRISDTTPKAYWWALVAVGVAVFVWLGATRLREWKQLVLAGAATAVGALVLLWVYNGASTL